MGLMNMFKKKETNVNYQAKERPQMSSLAGRRMAFTPNRVDRALNNATNRVMGFASRRTEGLRKMQMSQISDIRSGKVPFHQRRVAETIRKSASMPFPQAYKTIQSSGSSGQRGRPKGSVKYPGGVYAYRKAMRAQNALMRQQQVVQQYQQMQQSPQETQGYQQQMPQQQVYQPQPGEYPYPTQVAPPQREVRPVFKSSGGSPYPPVSRQPLQPANAHPGYVETVDLFSGKKSFKQLPQAEAWVR
jgi:hypothetical protein